MHQQQLPAESQNNISATPDSLAVALTLTGIAKPKIEFSFDDFLTRITAAVAAPLQGTIPQQISDLPQLRKLATGVTIAQPWNTEAGRQAFAQALSLGFRKVVAITGGMGTGKTRMVVEYLRNETLLYVAPTRLLCEQQMRNVPGAMYATAITGADAEGRPIGTFGAKAKAVFCCPASLHRLKDCQFDHIVYDEAMGTVQQMSTDVCADHRDQMLVAWERLTAKAKRITVIDANLTPECVEALVGRDTEYHCLHSTAQVLKSDVTLLEGTQSAAYAHIQNKADQGQTIAVIQDAIANAEKLVAYHAANGTAALLITKETQYGAAQYAFLHGDDTFWERYDFSVVVMTSIVGAGYSIEGPKADNFDAVYSIASCANGQSVADYAQALYRIRSSAPRFVWAARACSGKAFMKTHSYAARAAGYGYAVPGSAAVLRRTIEEQCNAREFIFTYLLDQGCTIKHEKLTVQAVGLPAAGRVARKSRVDRVLNAADISAEEATRLSTERYVAPEQLFSLQKFNIRARYGWDLSRDMWALVLTPSWHYKAEAANYLMDFDLAVGATQPDVETYAMPLSSEAEFLVGAVLQVGTGCLEPLISLMKGEHTDLTGESDRWYHTKLNAERIAYAFGIRGCATFQALLGRLCGKFGIKRTRTRNADGSWAYSLDLAHFALWQAAVKVGTAAIDKVKATIERITVAAGGVVKRTIKLVMETLAIPTKEEQVALAWSRRVESNFGKPYMAFCEQVTEWMDELCKGDVEHLIALDARFEKLRDGKTDADFNNPEFRAATKTAIVQYFEAMTNPTEADAPLLIIDRAAIAQTVPAVIQTKSFGVVGDYVVQQHLMPGLTADQREDSAWHLGRAAADKFARGYVQCVETFIEVADFMLSGLDAEIERLRAGGATIG